MDDFPYITHRTLSFFICFSDYLITVSQLCSMECHKGLFSSLIIEYLLLVHNSINVLWMNEGMNLALTKWRMCWKSQTTLFFIITSWISLKSIPFSLFIGLPPSSGDPHLDRWNYLPVFPPIFSTSLFSTNRALYSPWKSVFSLLLRCQISNVLIKPLLFGLCQAR